MRRYSTIPGNQIRSLRRSLNNVRQKDLAKSVGTTPANISQIEKEVVPLTYVMAFRILEALGKLGAETKGLINDVTAKRFSRE